MRLALFGLAAVTAVAFGSGTASAQGVVIQPSYAPPNYLAPAYPAYSPGVFIGGAYTTPGLAIGGVVAPAGFGYAPAYRYGYPGYYYGGYRGYVNPYHHYRRW